MTHQRQNGVIFSALLHFVWLIFAVFGLPLLSNTLPPPEPQSISVELLPISEMSNVRPSENDLAKEEKQEQHKKQETPKPPTPPAKADNAPPPPAPTKPEEKPKPQPPAPKPPEKKPEPKKPKSTDADFAKVLNDLKKNSKPTDKKAPDQKATSTSKSDRYNPEVPLSMSEMDAIKSQFVECWRKPAGSKNPEELIVPVEIELAQDGAVLKVNITDEVKSRYNSNSFYRAAADAAVRAVHECSPLKNLPTDKYETWHYMILNFDPRE